MLNIERDTRGKGRYNLSNLLGQSPQEAADIINDRFAAYFTDEPNWIEVTHRISDHVTSDQWLPDTSVTNVSRLIQSLDTKKSPVSDNLPPLIIIFIIIIRFDATILVKYNSVTLR